jgi:hypothetical protein
MPVGLPEGFMALQPSLSLSDRLSQRNWARTS